MQKMTSTKDEIMHLIKKYKKLAVADLESQLGITGMAVRRHLHQLEIENYIEAETIRQNMGRPVQFYSLTKMGEERFPRNYSNMTVEFLHDIEEISGPEIIDALFIKREQRLEEKYRVRTEEKSLKDRVAVLADIQNENGYMVEWNENQDGDFELIEYNCPIFKVASRYHKACSCEHSLFQKVLQTEKVEQVCCMAKGGNFCKYLIKSQS